jgi:Transposase
LAQSVIPIAVLSVKSCRVAQRLSIPRLTGLKRFMEEIRPRPLPRHGTDHDSKPLCLAARPLQCRQEEYRSGRATAQGSAAVCSRCHFAGVRLRPTRRNGALKNIARSLRQHRELNLNYFRAQKLLLSGVVEGLNNKAKVTMRKSYGFRTFRCLELAFYNSLGKLPEPESTHEYF